MERKEANVPTLGNCSLKNILRGKPVSVKELLCITLWCTKAKKTRKGQGATDIPFDVPKPMLEGREGKRSKDYVHRLGVFIYAGWPTSFHQQAVYATSTIFRGEE